MEKNMRILNFGSLNIDRVYTVSHFVRPGETISAESMKTSAGGKGLNQSIALSKSHSSVFHAGKIGTDGKFLVDILHAAGVNTDNIITNESIPTGHAIIQVDERGQNSILLYSGANRSITESDVDAVLSEFTSGDYLLLQNETSCLSYCIEQANRKGMRIILNPSPMDEILKSCDLSKISWLIMNEIEGKMLTNKNDPETICDSILSSFPECRIVLTLGPSGSMYVDKNICYRHPTYDTPVVDTTGAGDTFTGFFFSGIISGLDPLQSLELASKAASIAVSRHGAASSIPTLEEVQKFDAPVFNVQTAV